jgi:hypothetical protein
MNLQSVLSLLSVVTASLILFIGVVLLTGLFLPGQIPENYRYTLGGIMTVYALYRIGMAVARYRRQGDGNGNGDALP